jgi:hypothetical protein
VTALASNLLTDTHAKNAHMARDKTQETHKDVFQPQDVTLETKLSDSEILKTATTAEHAPSHKFQDKTDQSAIDQSQLAVALKDLRTTNAFHAPTDKYLMIQEPHATQHHHAMELIRFLEQDKTATDATLAQQILFQMNQEPNV